MQYLLAVVAVVAAVGCKSKAADEFDDYATGAKATEANLMLNLLAKSAKNFAMMNNALPVAKAPLTPAQPCCASADHKCPVDPNNWAGEPWHSLEFEIGEPHYFRYDYESDGKTFTAHAVGDLHCNGKLLTFTLRGTVDPATGATTTEIDDPLAKHK